jgi:hypothetical protein
MSGLELAPARSEAPWEPWSDNKFQPLLDVVGEIAKFRKKGKAAYDYSIHMGHTEPEAEGYWSGSVTVVRKALDQDAGELDCYGNRYESGWYYR